MSSTRLEPNLSRYKVARGSMVTHLVEDRRASLSPWGLGNSKIGPMVYTYSKLAGQIWTCPGATPHCEAVCYAKPKRMGENPAILWLYERNTERGDDLPPLPEDATLVRGHVSGDFDTPGYVASWIALAATRPDVKFWFYTRSWRVPAILPALEILRTYPNVQVWASMDPDCELPPEGWRRAWLDTDPRIGTLAAKYSYRTEDGVLAPACPEETGLKENCGACGYCFEPFDGDLVFLEHAPPKDAR